MDSDLIDKISLKYTDEYQQIVALLAHYTEKKIEIEKDIEEISKLKAKLSKQF